MSGNNQIINAKVWEPAQWVFAPAVKKQKGDKTIVNTKFNYNGVEVPLVQTPWLKVQFDIGDYQGDGKFRLTVAAIAENPAQQPAVDDFFRKHADFRECFFKWAMENSLTIFGKEYKNMETVEEKCNYPLKDKNPDFAKTIVVSLPNKYVEERDDNGNIVKDEKTNRPKWVKTDQPKGLYYDKSSGEIVFNNFEEMQKTISRGSFVKVIYSTNFWCTSVGAGLKFNVEQMLFKARPPMVPTGFAFTDEEDTPTATTSTAAPAESTPEEPGSPEETPDEEAPEGDDSPGDDTEGGDEEASSDGEAEVVEEPTDSDEDD